MCRRPLLRRVRSAHGTRPRWPQRPKPGWLLVIRLIEALNFRCLRYIRQPLDDFQILVGPNASGKTTFLDVPGFLGDLLEVGLDEAIAQRSEDIHDLFFLGRGSAFELAVELEIPHEQRELLPQEGQFRFVRYEVRIGIDPDTNEHRIFDEQGLLLPELTGGDDDRQRPLFPEPPEPPPSIMQPKMTRRAVKRTFRKVDGGSDYFNSELTRSKGSSGFAPSFKLGPRKSALANMPDDEVRFPVTTWLRGSLMDRTQKLMLNSLALRASSKPGQGQLFRPDGSNLPWVIAQAKEQDPQRHKAWINHVRTALPDVEDVAVTEIPSIRHRFLQVVYRGGLKVPSWMASDGTLRMLALTLPAYLDDFRGAYLIEEPENGIHPLAMETVYQALRSVYDAQILLATHSPVILGCASEEEILCFAKDAEGATDIVRGSRHPGLQTWRGEISLQDLYASGVLG